MLNKCDFVNIMKVEVISKNNIVVFLNMCKWFMFLKLILKGILMIVIKVKVMRIFKIIIKLFLEKFVI